MRPIQQYAHLKHLSPFSKFPFPLLSFLSFRKLTAFTNGEKHEEKVINVNIRTVRENS